MDAYMVSQYYMDACCYVEDLYAIYSKSETVILSEKQGNLREGSGIALIVWIFVFDRMQSMAY